jgi:hypothetical protein
MGLFLGLADMVAIGFLATGLIIAALVGAVAISVWLDDHPVWKERIGGGIALCVGIPMLLLFGFGVGHLAYVALVATYSWFVT